MAGTEFPLNHPLAVQVWSNSLAVESGKRQYFSKFMGTGESALIVVKTELQKQAGEKITVGLRMKLREDGVEGDNLIEGTSAEEALTFFSDSLFIDQKRKGTKSKGKMSEQRVPYNLRKEGRDALATWWSEYYDEQFMMYLSGARGINADFISPLSFKGRANNPLQGARRRAHGVRRVRPPARPTSRRRTRCRSASWKSWLPRPKPSTP